MKGVLKRFTGQSDANTAKTVSTSGVSPKKLLQVTVAFDDTPSYTGTNLQVVLNSGAGEDYDSLLQTGTNNGQYFNYVPESPITLMDDDDIDVVVPAGGADKVSSIVIITEEIGY